jgi:cell division septation protein DedD
MVEERRQYQRLVPNAPLFVSLDESKSGLLLDLCEGGLAVASLLPRTPDEIVSLSFELPEGVGHVQAKAQIAWTRDAGHLTGVRFIDLDDASQQQLREWISTGTNLRLAPVVEAAEAVLVTRSSYAHVDPVLVETRQKGLADLHVSLLSGALASEPEPAVENPGIVSTEVGAPAAVEGGRASKSRHTIELFVAVVILSWALVFLGYRMGITGTGRQVQEVTAATGVTEAATKSELASVGALPTAISAAPVMPATVSVTTPARTSTPVAALAPKKSLMGSGMVLQVGAMKSEDHAAALARDLRKKKFPAMVFRHGTDKLYRVAVGPYSDADSTGKVKDQLQKHGFKALVQRWNAE